MILYDYNKITIRLLTIDDALFLVKWLSDPVVLQYYQGRDQPYDINMVRQHFFERKQEITQCIIQYEGIAIGYIQFYPVFDAERTEYGYDDFEGTVYGMDQLIGEPEYWNRGIGTELIQSMVNYLIQHERVDKIVMDPQTWNHRALRVYEKCGFSVKKLLPRHELHEGEYKDCWLIEYGRKD